MAFPQIADLHKKWYAVKEKRCLVYPDIVDGFYTSRDFSNSVFIYVSDWFKRGLYEAMTPDNILKVNCAIWSILTYVKQLPTPTVSLNSKVKQCCLLNLYVPSAIKLVQANCTPRNKPSISDLSPPIAIKLEQRSSCFLVGHTLSLTRMHIKSSRISKYIHIRRAAHHRSTEQHNKF